MADHKQGSMDITAQEKTFNGFVTFVMRTCYVLLALAVFLMIFRT